MTTLKTTIINLSTSTSVITNRSAIKDIQISNLDEYIEVAISREIRFRPNVITFCIEPIDSVEFERFKRLLLSIMSETSSVKQDLHLILNNVENTLTVSKTLSGLKAIDTTYKMYYND